jgi:hypothetical protein
VDALLPVAPSSQFLASKIQQSAGGCRRAGAHRSGRQGARLAATLEMFWFWHIMNFGTLHTNKVFTALKKPVASAGS